MNRQITTVVFLAALSCLLFFNPAFAQIATPEGQIQGGNRGDSGHFVDKPAMHVHEQTTVIEVKKKGQPEPSSGDQNKGRSADGNSATTQAIANDTAGAVASPEVVGSSNTSITEKTTETKAMGDMDRIYAALATFGIGALIGLFILIMIFNNRKAPLWLTLLHGALGLGGIGLLVFYSMHFPGPIVSIVIFAIAATGGLLVFYHDVQNKPIPKWLAVLHGVVAVGGIISLVVYAVNCNA